MGLNTTLVAQIIHLLLLIAILVIVPILALKLLISRSKLFKNIEILAIEMKEVRKLLEKNLKNKE